MNYYVSDLHLGHKNIFLYEPNRPGNSIEEMNSILINNIKDRLTKNDKLYILGDFAFKTKDHTIKMIESEILSIRAKCDNIYLIVGNHDKDYIEKREFNTRLFNSITPYAEIYDGKDYVILSHYPIEVWNHKEHGSIHLHGHTHNTYAERLIKNRYNVGCVFYDYKPVTLEEIKNSWDR